MVEVTLTSSELYAAGVIGVARQVSAMAKRLTDRNGAKAENGFKLHILGACGEMAVAKATGRYWPATCNTFKKGGDIESRIQIRTRSDHKYDLIVRDDDRDGDVFVLVIGCSDKFTVYGWLSGSEAKILGDLKDYGDRGAAYFVPKNLLHGIETLPQEVIAIPTKRS